MLLVTWIHNSSVRMYMAFCGIEKATARFTGKHAVAFLIVLWCVRGLELGDALHLDQRAFGQGFHGHG